MRLQIGYLGVDSCPSHCGSQADVIQIGRFTKLICQTCGHISDISEAKVREILNRMKKREYQS